MSGVNYKALWGTQKANIEELQRQLAELERVARIANEGNGMYWYDRWETEKKERELCQRELAAVYKNNDNMWKEMDNVRVIALKAEAERDALKADNDKSIKLYGLTPPEREYIGRALTSQIPDRYGRMGAIVTGISLDLVSLIDYRFCEGCGEKL